MPKGASTPSLSKTAASMSGDEINCVLDAGIRAFHRGFVTYPDTADGLTDFRRDSERYLTYVRDINERASQDNTCACIPDVESWAAYLGITRKTINRYEKQRGEEWAKAIESVKGIITACKKQLAFVGKMPPVLAIFDLTNNSGYVNASEFKLTTDSAPENKQITAEEWEKVIDAEQVAPDLFIGADCIASQDIPSLDEFKN